MLIQGPRFTPGCFKKTRNISKYKLIKYIRPSRHHRHFIASSAFHRRIKQLKPFDNVPIPMSNKVLSLYKVINWRNINQLKTRTWVSSLKFCDCFLYHLTFISFRRRLCGQYTSINHTNYQTAQSIHGHIAVLLPSFAAHSILKDIATL